jgi:hypothetical protein
MAITDYSTLQTSIADFLNRDDLTSVIPTFISLAEAQMNRDLRHWRQQRRVTTTLDEQFENMPSDMVEPTHLYIDTSYGEKTLEFASLAEISRRKLRKAGITGEPVVFTMNSGQFEFVPAPDDSYDLTMVYYSRVDSLSDSTTTNWILEYHPDVYLYGAAFHAAVYLNDPAAQQAYVSMYSAAIQQANLESDKAIHSGGPLVMRNR